MGFYKQTTLESFIKPVDEKIFEEPERELCPICGKSFQYRKTRMVKLGTFDGKYFKATGEERRTTYWWTCKTCAKKTPIGKYVEEMIKYYKNKYE